MNPWPADPLPPPAPFDHGEPCGPDCAFARTIRADPYADAWLWCAHPANSTHLVHPGRPCARYAPAGVGPATGMPVGA
ncbi:hypothetical protein [Oleiharenicola sp. Vm1]|uniref:hypothetical protein n=1 Tax=Oleiharenicola sp. Vm1 TaxID=3398393 RepID=UPI0039F5354B